MPKFLFSEHTMSEEAKDPITAAITEELHHPSEGWVDKQR
jgi:hypothetical protein